MVFPRCGKLTSAFRLSTFALLLGYRFNETCQETVPEALICALEAKDFEDAIRNAVSIGGDSDTVAAIAGGVAEGLFGIPKAMAEEALSRLPDDMKRVLGALYSRRG